MLIRNSDSLARILPAVAAASPNTIRVEGREISRTGTNDLPLDKEAISGYSLINAENIEEAEKIAEGCPMITSVKVFEAMSM